MLIIMLSSAKCAFKSLFILCRPCVASTRAAFSFASPLMVISKTVRLLSHQCFAHPTHPAAPHGRPFSRSNPLLLGLARYICAHKFQKLNHPLNFPSQFKRQFPGVDQKLCRFFLAFLHLHCVHLLQYFYSPFSGGVIAFYLIAILYCLIEIYLSTLF